MPRLSLFESVKKEVLSKTQLGLFVGLGLIAVTSLRFEYVLATSDDKMRQYTATQDMYAAWDALMDLMILAVTTGVIKGTGDYVFDRLRDETPAPNFG
jgi:hypothetical protein